MLPKTTLVYDIQYVPKDDSFRTSKKGMHQSIATRSQTANRVKVFAGKICVDMDTGWRLVSTFREYGMTHRIKSFRNVIYRSSNAPHSMRNRLKTFLIISWCVHLSTTLFHFQLIDMPCNKMGLERKKTFGHPFLSFCFLLVCLINPSIAFFLFISSAISVPANGTWRAGDIRAIGSTAWLTHSIDLRSISLAAHRNAYRFRNATKEILNKFASIAAAHQQCLQRPDGLFELDKGGDYLRRRLWFVYTLLGCSTYNNNGIVWLSVCVKRRLWTLLSVHACLCIAIFYSIFIHRLGSQVYSRRRKQQKKLND